MDALGTVLEVAVRFSGLTAGTNRINSIMQTWPIIVPTLLGLVSGCNGVRIVTAEQVHLSFFFRFDVYHLMVASICLRLRVMSTSTRRSHLQCAINTKERIFPS